MKLSEGLSKPVPSILLFAVVVPGIILQALAMRQASMSITYVLVLGFEAVMALLIGATFLNEHHSHSKLLGLTLVLAGMLVLHR